MSALPGNVCCRPNAGAPRPGTRILGRLVAILLILLTPLLLGAWRDASGNTINPNYVKRIENGKTTKHEILLYFGDPQEFERSADGPVFKYFSYKDSPAWMPYKPETRKPQEQSTSLYIVDENKHIKKAPEKKEGKILRSTLTIRFKPDGDTVMSYEYKEF